MPSYDTNPYRANSPFTQNPFETRNIWNPYGYDQFSAMTTGGSMRVPGLEEQKQRAQSYSDWEAQQRAAELAWQQQQSELAAALQQQQLVGTQAQQQQQLVGTQTMQQQQGQQAATMQQQQGQQASEAALQQAEQQAAMQQQQARIDAMNKLIAEQWARVNPLLGSLGFGTGQEGVSAYNAGGQVGGFDPMSISSPTGEQTGPINEAYNEATRSIYNTAPTGRNRDALLAQALQARMGALGNALTGTRKAAGEQYTTQRGQNMSLLAQALQALTGTLGGFNI